MEHEGEKEAQVVSGWIEFLTEKLAMLDAFERSKIQIANRPTQTGKAQLRKQNLGNG